MIPQDLIDEARRARSPKGTSDFRPIELAREHGFGRAHVRSYRDVIAPALAGIDLSDGRVLDAGCGAGFHSTLAAADGVGWVCGMDVGWSGYPPTSAVHHQTYLRIGEEVDLDGLFEFTLERSLFNQERLSFAQGDVARLPFADESFDAVFSFNGLEHFGDVDGALREMSRVLRPGGVMFVHAEPLFYSCAGSHLYELLPIPWGHLFGDADELIDVYMDLYGGEDVVSSEQPVTVELMRELLSSLNRARVGEMRRAALGLGMRVVWAQQNWSTDDLRDARRLRIAERAPGDVSLEDAVVHKFSVVLKKESSGLIDSMTLRLPFAARRWAPWGMKRCGRRLLFGRE